MAEFGWAYVSGSQIPDGLDGSLQYKKGNEISGSNVLVFDEAANTLVLSGTLNVSGAINANELNLNVTNKTVTNISATGSTKFGDSTDDQHNFIGTMVLTASDESALVYKVTASVWEYLSGPQVDTDNGGVAFPGHGGSSYFYLTSSNSVQRGILNFQYETAVDSGVSASVADAATFEKAVNPALVVSGAAIFKEPISVQGGLYGASPIRIYAPMVFSRDDLTESSPDDEMKIEQGKFRGNVIISSSNDNHGLWMEGAGYIVMNSKKTLSTNERAPEFVQNNRTSDRGSYPAIYQRVMQSVPVAENPFFLTRRHGNSRHNVGEMRWTTEFPILTGSNSASAAHYKREDRDVVRLLISTDPRRNATGLAFQVLDSNMDPEYEGLDAINSNDRNLAGYLKPIIHPNSPVYVTASQNYSSSLSNILTLGGNGNAGQGNIYGLKRSAILLGNLLPGGWANAQDAGFASNFDTKDCTIGHPVARWGDFYIHDDRYIRWGQPAGTSSRYKDYYNSNPLTASARIDSGSVIFGYNSSSTFLEVSGATAYLNDSLNITGSGYVNFGLTKGSTGYGLRDNAGSVQFKHNSGEWRNIDSIGEAEDVGTPTGYVDGLFDELATTTNVGTVIDRFNEVFKIIAPPPCPKLSRINYVAPPASAAKLSFDASNPITDYVASSDQAGFTAVARNSSYELATTGSHFRIGVYNGAQEITGTINFLTPPNSVNGFLNFASGAFAKGGEGTLKLELNGVTIHTTNLSSFIGAGSTGTGSANSLTNGSGFVNVSLSGSSFDGNGAEWYIFQHRTAKYKIEANDQKTGLNYLRVVHTVGDANYRSNYVEWVNDPDGAALALAAVNPRVENVTLQGSKYISGVQYNTGITGSYRVDITNMYRNVYPSTSNTITFTPSNANTIPAQSVSALGGGDDETKVASVTGSLVYNSIYLLNGTISTTLSATHPLKANLSNAGAASITGMLIDNSASANSNLLETFEDEDFRITSGSYSTQNSVTAGAATWESENHMTSSGATGHDNGLLFYNRKLYSPRSSAVANSGNFSTLANVSPNQPNYSGLVGMRTFYRKVENNSGGAIHDIKITMKKYRAQVTNKDMATQSDNNEINIFVKIPEQTGWMKANNNFVYGSVLDADGALVELASDNSNVASNDEVTAVHCLTFGTASVANNGHFVVKVLAHTSWLGYIEDLQFQLGASDVSAPTESFLLDDIDLDDTAGETVKLSFGTSNGVTGYTNVAGGVGSMGAVNSNGTYTDNSDTNRGAFKTIEVMGGTLNEDISQSAAGSFLNYTAKSFKNAHTGSLLLIVNDTTASTLALSNLTSNNNLSSGTGFSVGVVGYSTTTDGIPDYTKSYRTGTFSVGTGQQRSGWNYARVLHTIGGTETPTNYIQWVVDTSGAVDNTAVTTPTLSDFGHTSIYYQSGIKYYASNPTASFNFEASNFYSNVCATGSNVISFPTTTNCQVTNIRAVGTGITTFDSGVSQTGMPALNNNAGCETTSIQVTGTLQYDGATPSIFGSLSTFADQDVAVNAKVLHPLKSDRTTSTANKANLMVYSGSIGSTNLNTEEYFRTETYRIVSNNYANQAAIISNAQAWNSQTALNNGGTHDDGMVTAAGYALSPFKIGVAGNTGHASLQAPAGNPDYSSLTNNTRTFYRYFRNNSGVLKYNNMSISLYGDANLVGKSGAHNGSLGANKNIHVELKVPSDPNYTGGDDRSTGWCDVIKDWDDTEDLAVDGAGILSVDPLNQTVPPGGRVLPLEFQGKGIYNNQYFVVKISVHKDWTGYLSRIRMAYS